MTAVTLVGGSLGFCAGMPDPVEDGLRLSDPVETVFHVLTLPEQPSAISVVCVLPAGLRDYPLTAWLDEDLRNATLKDRIELFVPQREHLTGDPLRARREAEAETLAPMVPSTARSE